jgi:predicted alpha/beta-fold hydrolase
LNYCAPWWLPGGNLQTIWPALSGRRVAGERPRYRRERWVTPDSDFIDLDWLDDEAPTLAAAGAAPPAEKAGCAGNGPMRQPSLDARPLLVLFHGLEGSSRSHYAEAFADFARLRGLAFVVPHFRGCSGEPNHAARAYHSGDYEEIGWMLARLRQAHAGPLLAVGVSLGGNALMRWAAEAGDTAAALTDAIAAVCSPLDLAAGSVAIGHGFNRLVYTTMFLRSMKPKAMQKLKQHPGLFDGAKLMAAADLHTFDDIFTAPVHGFRDADDYYARASARPHLRRIRIPALALNTLNDPFVPAASLPRADEAAPGVTLWHTREGGHVGFPDGHRPGHVGAMPGAVGDWLIQRIR